MAKQLNSSELLDMVFDVDFIKFVEMCEEVLNKDIAFDERDSLFYVFDKHERDYSRLVCCVCKEVMKTGEEHCPGCGLDTNLNAYIHNKSLLVSDGLVPGAEYSKLTKLRRIEAIEFTCAACGQINLLRIPEGENNIDRAVCPICRFVNIKDYTLHGANKND